MPNRAAEWRAKVEADCPGAVLVGRYRNGFDWMLPGPNWGSEFRLWRSIGEVLTLPTPEYPGGQEIDTDLDDDGTFFRGRVLDYGLRFDRQAGRVMIPRPPVPSETMTQGRPQRFFANQWRTVTPTGFQRIGHQVIFQTVGGEVRVSVKPTGLVTEVVLNGAAANVPWRWPLTLVGLTWVDGADGVTLVSQSDSQTVLYMGRSFWQDSSTPPKQGPVTVTFAGGYLTYAAPVLPANVVFPVVVR